MAILPSNRNLFIPGKAKKPANKAAKPGPSVPHDTYQKDMQTLEMWARQPIQQLVAGSGITLTPSSGLASNTTGGPNPITIAATGGGSSVNVGAGQLIAQPDDNEMSVSFFFPFTGDDFGSEGQSYWYAFSNPTTDRKLSISASWMIIVSSGDSVNIFPTLTLPTFTGGTGSLGFLFWFWAADATFSNYAVYTGSNVASGGTSGLTYQFQASDLTFQHAAGGDLTLVAGSGNTGVGLVSGGGGITYWAGVGGALNVPAGTTFT
jgi:hypothetical protein